MIACKHCSGTGTNWRELDNGTAVHCPRCNDGFVGVEPDDSMDGDHDSAMAAAGWGTDEDYGFYGDDQ